MWSMDTSGFCLCGMDETEEHSKLLRSMVTVEFEVSDFSAFFKRFESIEKSSFLSEAGATAVFLGESRVGKGFFAKGVPVAQLTLVFEASKRESIATALDMSRQPFEEYVKSGLIKAATCKYTWSEVETSHAFMDVGLASIMVVAFVPTTNCKTFAKAFPDGGAPEGLEVTKTLVGRVVGGQMGAHIVHIAPTTSEAALKRIFNTAKEPLAGLVAAGTISLPSEVTVSRLAYNRE